MSSSLVRRLVYLSAIIFIPAAASAQEAVLIGSVIDATGAVLPGVTIKALHQASGNTFETVTDERGAYRIPGDPEGERRRRWSRHEDRLREREAPRCVGHGAHRSAGPRDCTTC